MNLRNNVSLNLPMQQARNRTLAVALTTVLKVLNGWRCVELMVSIETAVLVPSTSSTACCVTPGTGVIASSSFWAASISSRTQVAGAIGWSTLLLDSCYFVNECSANSTRRGRWSLVIPRSPVQLEPAFRSNRAAIRRGFSKKNTQVPSVELGTVVFKQKHSHLQRNSQYTA